MITPDPTKTTPHEDETILKTAGQRKVNLIWEGTQSTIAIAVTITVLIVSAVLALQKEDAASALLLSNAFFLVIGFYFGRTNHQRTGGVGSDDAGR